MLVCQFCGIEGTADDGCFQIDTIKKGFGCESCDCYNYTGEPEQRHKFTLILEDKSRGEPVVRLPLFKTSKRISPFRYPGGKTKIIDYLYTHLQAHKTKKLISPFTGGGSFELALLDAGVIEQLHMNDLDKGVYGVWYLIKHDPEVLIHRLRTIEPTHEDYFVAQKIIRSDYEGVDMITAAWSALLVNRLAYSGICKASPLGGKQGDLKALRSRWNPNELIRRIDKIHALSNKIEVTRQNAVELIEEAYWEDKATIFIDPPYVAKGKDLYHCFYKEKDHIELALLLDSLHSGFPGADILVTYDYNEWIDQLYNYPKKHVIGRVYSA